MGAGQRRDRPRIRPRRPTRGQELLAPDGSPTGADPDRRARRRRTHRLRSARVPPRQRAPAARREERASARGLDSVVARRGAVARARSARRQGALGRRRFDRARGRARRLGRSACSRLRARRRHSRRLRSRSSRSIARDRSTPSTSQRCWSACAGPMQRRTPSPTSGSASRIGRGRHPAPRQAARAGRSRGALGRSSSMLGSIGSTRSKCPRCPSGDTYSKRSARKRCSRCSAGE